MTVSAQRVSRMLCCELRRQLYDNNLHMDMRKSVNLV